MQTSVYQTRNLQILSFIVSLDAFGACRNFEISKIVCGLASFELSIMTVGIAGARNRGLRGCVEVSSWLELFKLVLLSQLEFSDDSPL